MKLFATMPLLLAGVCAGAERTLLEELAVAEERNLHEGKDAEMVKPDSQLLETLRAADAVTKSTDFSKCIALSKDAVACGSCTETGDVADIYEALLAGDGAYGELAKKKPTALLSDCDIVMKDGGRNREGDDGSRQLQTCFGFVLVQSMCTSGICEVEAAINSQNPDGVRKDDATPYESATLSQYASSAGLGWYTGYAWCRPGTDPVCLLTVQMYCPLDNATGSFYRSRPGGNELIGVCHCEEDRFFWHKDN